MNVRLTFHLVLVAVLATACSSNSSDDPTVPTNLVETAETPNILLIIADDMGLDATPGYTEGITKPDMPTLESLMASGITFENFWSSPVCTPTRATILTGKYGTNTGILGVGDEITPVETSIQKYLNDNTGNAYSHAVVGKWHLSTDATNPTQMGIDYYAGLLSGGVPSYTSWRLTENGSASNSTEYTTSKFTDLAINWLDNQQDNPWFLWVAYNAPHTPFHLPPVALHSQGNLPTDQASIDANPLPYYLAALEAMDTEMGRLIGSLTEDELANTLIIFIGDNGTPNQVVQSPYRRQTAKGSLYQGGVNVPLIVSGAGVTRSGARETALVNSTDLFATIADLAGTGTEAIHNSQSIKGLFTDTNSNFREVIYTDMDNEGNAGYAIRNNTYKLIVFDDGSREFYNLQNDPYEGNNLLSGALNDTEASALTSLQQQAAQIRE